MRRSSWPVARKLAALLGSAMLASVAVPAVAEVVPTTVRDNPLVLGAGVVYRDETYRGFDNSEKWRPLPLVMWEGERFFARATNFGWKAWKNESFEFDVLAEFRGDGYESGDADILEGMSDRDPTVDGGVQLTWRNGPWGLRGTWVTDLTSEHEGWEGRAQVMYTVISENRNWIFEPSAMLVYQSEDLVNYYYGVEQDEVIDDVRPFYDADSELIYRFQAVTLWNPGGSKLQLMFGARFDLQGDEFDQSPITDDEKRFMGFFAAGYRF